jgi:alanyl aminopeptidase
MWNGPGACLSLAPRNRRPFHIPIPILGSTFVFSLFLAACAQPAPAVAPAPAAAPAPAPAAAPAPVAAEPLPTLRLPADTRPLAESIELHIDPRQERFSGAVDIEVQLAHPRSTLWLHGKDMHVTEASVTPEGGAPVAGLWQDRHESGVASIGLPSAIPAGRAHVRIVFDAPFGRGQKGLYTTAEANESYAFTQFEAIAARLAFPCFDEPGFKIPFTTTLVVPAGMQAVANTREVSRAPIGGDAVRVSFAPTLPLPSYLVAFAVGPLDIVPVADVPPNATRTRPLPLRGVAPRGRGKDMAYALAHTGEIVGVLENYFGIGYPWDKLDILAVPGKGGAMENAGAITYSERLVLFDGATAPVSQRRAYASVMAHELAHQWTGDLVTMAWWDDTWLNEAFATWMAAKATQTWDPTLHQDIALLRGVQGAMGADSLVSARAIRQPIASTHDIENAFDSITYQKGAGVIGMFEHWVGPEAWQKGVRAYLQAHKFGNATADDFLDAQVAATGKDVKTAMHTFLDQPGVPLLEVTSRCAPQHASLHVRQSRFLPVGSTGSAQQLWQVPFCTRVGGATNCSLLTQAETDVDLGAAKACPLDYSANADASGYYRFSLAPADLAALAGKLRGLSTREKMAYANSLRAAYARATTPMKDVVAAAAPLAADPMPAVAEEPMGYVVQARDWLVGDPLEARVERYGRELYAPAMRRLGWEPKKGEDDEARALRASVVWFLAMTARDPAVRAEAKKRGAAYLGIGKDGALHPEAVDPNLASAAVGVVGEEADRATWEAMKALLQRSVDEAVRGRIIWALGAARDPQLAEAGRQLVLDPSLRDNEMLTPLYAQISRPETREAAWTWLKEHYDAILTRLPRHHGGVQLVGAGRQFCDEARARDVEAFFGPKIEAIEGGPRALASTLEDVRLCSALRAAQEKSARELFGRAR